MIAVLCKDPYRLLFPIALLNFVLGLVIWLPSLLGISASFPLVEHMQLLMRGTMYGFIIGFLLTMLPRVWGAPFISMASLIVYVMCFLAMPVALALHLPGIFEIATVVALSQFTYQCFARFPQQRSQFTWAISAVILLTFFVNIVSALLYFGAIPPSAFTSWAQNISLQGSVLLFIFALAPFLISKFGGSGPCCSLQNQMQKPLFLRILPIFVILVFALTYAFPYHWLARSIRMVLLTICFQEAIGLFRWPRMNPWFYKGIWISLWCILIGQALPLLFIEHTIIWNHVMYIPGFMLLCLMVGARVVCGHAQQLERVEGDRIGVIAIIALLFISVLSRVGVDWAPETRVLHLILAGLFALFALMVWFVYFGRFLYADGSTGSTGSTKQVKHA